MDEVILTLECYHDCIEYIHRLPYRMCWINCYKTRDPPMKFTLDLLNMFSNLTHLNITEAKIKIGNLRDLISIKMPKLVHLELDSESYEFLTIIQSLKVQNFVYTHIPHLMHGDQLFNGVLMEFLTTCTTLKHLKFKDGIPKFDYSNCSFKLHSLQLRIFSIHSKFIDFLRTQKDSLQELIFEVCMVKSEILNFIYFDMNLKKLFDIHWSRSELERKFNHSIKFLVINNRMKISEDVTLMEQAVNSCQSLEYLYIEIEQFRLRQILRMLSRFLPILKVVELNFKVMKKFKKISSWVRSNGFHTSLILRHGSMKFAQFFKEGSGDFHGSEFTVLVSSTKGNSNCFHQLGCVKKVDSYFQISKIKGPFFPYCDSFNLRNLSMLRQERKSKKILRVRIFFDFIVSVKSRSNSYYEYFPYFHERDYYNSDESKGWVEDEMWSDEDED